MPQPDLAACIEACNACAIACNECAAACLREDDVKMMARCVALDSDCAHACQFAAAAMARGSEQAAAICGLCATLCQACGDECARHEHDHCQRCAAACLRGRLPPHGRKGGGMSAQAGEKAEKTGDFRCEKCHEKVHVQSGKKIPKCPNCGNDTFDTRVHEPANK